jgi:hypothetical protein
MRGLRPADDKILYQTWFISALPHICWVLPVQSMVQASVLPNLLPNSLYGYRRIIAYGRSFVAQHSAGIKRN